MDPGNGRTQVDERENSSAEEQMLVEASDCSPKDLHLLNSFP